MAIDNRFIPRNQVNHNDFLDGLVWGSGWNNETNVNDAPIITYSFADPSLVGYWSEQAKNALRAAMQTWENVANITFQEIPYTDINQANHPADIIYLAASGAELSTFFGEDVSDLDGYHDVPGLYSALYIADKTPYWNAPLAGVFNSTITNFGGAEGSYSFSTMVHELGHGLGLAHPHDEGGNSQTFPGVTQNFGDYGTHNQNQGINTIMSYNGGWASTLPPQAGEGYATGPMALDIAAIQAIYGANTTYNNGNNVYELPNYGPTGLLGWKSIWDTGGIDTITNEGSSEIAIIDLNPAILVGFNAGGSPSYRHGKPGGFTIANGVIIENATGGSADDTINGNGAANVLKGLAGNDTIYGGVGDDLIEGGDGNDLLHAERGNDTIYGGAGDDTISSLNGNNVLDGGDGNDTAIFSGNISLYQLVSQGNHIAVLRQDRLESDLITNIEQFTFADGSATAQSAEAFDTFRYLASNVDLIPVFGSDLDAAFEHYAQYGFSERRTVYFDALDYIASYSDLLTAFGNDIQQATAHFVQYGFSEGRSANFDEWGYIASYTDLLETFGTNSSQALSHYVNYGASEGRYVSFEALEYVASHTDLMNDIGTDSNAATVHYVTYGYAQGRQVTFEALEYTASYADLMDIFGTDSTTAAHHYIAYGRHEGREVTFDALAYIASYADLMIAFGTDIEQASSHYIGYGRHEGRSASFDVQAYLDANPDLNAQFNGDLDAATIHYIQENGAAS